MSYFAGLDIGSKSSKMVVLSTDGFERHYIIPTGTNSRYAGQRLLEMALQDLGLPFEQLSALVATGYGRTGVERAKTLSEITCQAKGISSLFPEAEVIIDIGGQDFKVIQLNKNGGVRSFAMNERCAAGTGRYLELMADIFELSLDEFGNAAHLADNPVEISSVCTVFAETEVVNHISRGVPEDEIVAGIFLAVAKRVASLAQRFLSNLPSFVFTGGVAKNAGVIKALAEVTGCVVQVPAEPQITAALGAALIAKKSVDM